MGKTSTGVMQQGPPPPPNSLPDPREPLVKSVQGLLWYKNRLQEYTQKLSIQLPVYQTVNESAQHAPKFRSTVLVDGTSYTSPNTFPQRKLAEQEAAKVALSSISQKDEGCRVIRVSSSHPLLKETIFCKSIVNEYAVKKRIGKPTYHTVQPEGFPPIFVSSLVLNGATYIGEGARNKKEAEQLAARAAILSLLDSESGDAISEIINSKSKFYDALNKAKHSSIVYGASTGAEAAGGITGVGLNKRKEPEVSTTDTKGPITGISESRLVEPVGTQTLPSCCHEFKGPKIVPQCEAIARPIEFVPAEESPQPVLPSTSGAKRSRRNKKKAKKGMLVNAQ